MFDEIGILMTHDSWVHEYVWEACFFKRNTHGWMDVCLTVRSDSLCLAILPDTCWMDDVRATSWRRCGLGSHSWLQCHRAQAWVPKPNLEEAILSHAGKVWCVVLVHVVQQLYISGPCLEFHVLVYRFQSDNAAPKFSVQDSGSAFLQCSLCWLGPDLVMFFLKCRHSNGFWFSVIIHHWVRWKNIQTKEV